MAESQSLEAEAFWTVAANSGQIRRLVLPALAAGEIRIKTLFSAISRGTESLVFRGHIPESEYERMRAPFQEGSYPFPVKYGYMNVGKVIDGNTSLIGQTVFCLYPHQTHYQVPEKAVTVLPDGLTAGRAILAANMETALNAIWDAQPTIGDRISIVGGGVVGVLIAYLASRIIGCHVQLIDINPDRKTIASVLGFTFSSPEQAIGTQDLVFHASASASGLNTAINVAGFEAKIIELSWYGTQKTDINLGGEFHSRRLQLISSQVGQIAIQQRSRWNYDRRLKMALNLLKDKSLDTLITDESSFHELPETMATLNLPDNAALCHRIHYE